MKQKKIIIVGASSGIGLEMAKIFAEQNHLVAVTGRRKELLDALQKEFPANIITAAFDIAGKENVQQLQILINQLDGLDIFIYNAGFGDISFTLNPQIEELTTQINVTAFVQTVSFAFNYFVEKGEGQIAATSSIAALRGNSWAPAYSASKAFMSIYAEGLNIKALKLSKKIIVTDVKPGFINTKAAKGNKRFWVAPPFKAAQQIVNAIDKKKRVVYITKRWWLIAQILKILPFSLYRKLA